MVYEVGTVLVRLVCQQDICNANGFKVVFTYSQTKLIAAAVVYVECEQQSNAPRTLVVGVHLKGTETGTTSSAALISYLKRKRARQARRTQAPALGGGPPGAVADGRGRGVVIFDVESKPRR